MTAFNVVRFKVKSAKVQEFVDAHRKVRPPFKGFLGGTLIKTGDQSFCFVGEWRTFQNIVNARPQMISFLDGFRDMLEDLGSGLGVSDPVSGHAVAKLAPPTAAKKKAPKLAPPKAAKKKKAPTRRKPKRAPAKKTASKR